MTVSLHAIATFLELTEQWAGAKYDEIPCRQPDDLEAQWSALDELLLAGNYVQMRLSFRQDQRRITTVFGEGLYRCIGRYYATHDVMGCPEFYEDKSRWDASSWAELMDRYAGVTCPPEVTKFLSFAAKHKPGKPIR